MTEFCLILILMANIAILSYVVYTIGSRMVKNIQQYKKEKEMYIYKQQIDQELRNYYGDQQKRIIDKCFWIEKNEPEKYQYFSENAINYIRNASTNRVARADTWDIGYRGIPIDMCQDYPELFFTPFSKLLDIGQSSYKDLLDEYKNRPKTEADHAADKLAKKVNEYKEWRQSVCI